MNEDDGGNKQPEGDMCYSATEREAVYRAIRERRDVRSEFVDKPIDEAVLARILRAAHHAPSVGLMQPWDFILLRDKASRARVLEGFNLAHEREARLFEGERREKYLSLPLQGILNSSLNVCVTCDKQRRKDLPVGRSAQSDMDRFSVVCAVQNMWLAARAEGIGVGWVSIVDPAVLREVMQLPEHIDVIAYLCIGYVSHFHNKPQLETAEWLQPLPLSELVHEECWKQDLNDWPELKEKL